MPVSTLQRRGCKARARTRTGTPLACASAGGIGADAARCTTGSNQPSVTAVPTANIGILKVDFLGVLRLLDAIGLPVTVRSMERIFVGLGTAGGLGHKRVERTTGSRAMTATPVVRLGTSRFAEYLGGLPESTLRYWRY